MYVLIEKDYVCHHIKTIKATKIIDKINNLIMIARKSIFWSSNI